MARSDGGLLIVFEGIDGAGKTTQVGHLCRYLAAAGVDAVRSREPTNGIWGQKIRASLTAGRLPPAEEVEAFVEDRREHVREVIGPALAAGKIVVLDRYFYSTVAYQGPRGGDVGELTRQMESSAPIPDAVILLDVLPEVGLGRVRGGRGEIPNAFEKEATLAQAREIFLHLAATHPNFIRIDGAEGEEAVRAEILTALLGGVLKGR